MINQRQAKHPLSSPWPDELPRLSQEEAQRVSDWVQEIDLLLTEVARCEVHLVDWARGQSPGLQWAELVCGPNTAEINQCLQGMKLLAAQQNWWQATLDRLDTEQTELNEQSSTAAQQYQLALNKYESKLEALTALQPLVQEILSIQARLSEALQRQAAQRTQTLTNLWSKLSGQAAALQREISALQHQHQATTTAFQLKVVSFHLVPEPKPEDVNHLLDAAP